MFTTHKTKEEFKTWWKQQDHKGHTKTDMVIYCLMKAHFATKSNLEAEIIKRGFTKHKKDGYLSPILALEHLKYCLKWKVRYGINTFKSVLEPCEDQTIHVVSSRIQNVIDALKGNEEAANAA